MNKYDVILVGGGPANLFAAIKLLKEKEDLKLLILEKGNTIDKRTCPKTLKANKCMHCNPCGISTGIGGAGAFSDGKLTLSSDIGGWLKDYIGDEIDDLIKETDDIYLEFGGNPIINYDEDFANELEYKCTKYGMKLIKTKIRHLGTDGSAEIMQKIYDKILSYNGAEILTKTPVIDIDFNNKIVYTENFEVHGDNIIIGVGRNGSDWLRNICKKNNIETLNNEVDVGVRVEVPRAITDAITDKLYEFKIINYSSSDNKVRTFCVNPGGIVSQENYDDNLACVNGHSYLNKKTNNTNFALLVSSKFTEPFNEPIKYGKSIARQANMLTGGNIMVQRLKDLKQHKRTDKNKIKKISITPTLKDAVPGDLEHVFTHKILNSILETIEKLDNIFPGINGENTLLYGVEVKFYSSKVKVNNNLETSAKDVYVIGDGAGITRGLIQSSASGLYVAKQILQRM